jgi:hypothetical protein
MDMLTSRPLIEGVYQPRRVKIMNREEEIRAKALEIAVISLGTSPAFEDGGDTIPLLLRQRIKAVEKYIRNGLPGGDNGPGGVTKAEITGI